MKCLDLDEFSKDNAHHFTQWDYFRGINQLSSYVFHEDGSVSVIVKDTGKALDVNAWSKLTGAKIIQFDPHFEDNQRWYIVEVNKARQILQDSSINQNKYFEYHPKRYALRNKNSGKCFDVGGWNAKNRADIIQWGCHYEKNQPVSPQFVTY